MASTSRPQDVAALTKDLVDELCRVYKRMLSSETELITARARIRELEDALSALARESQARASVGDVDESQILTSDGTEKPQARNANDFVKEMRPDNENLKGDVDVFQVSVRSLGARHPALRAHDNNQAVSSSAVSEIKTYSRNMQSVPSPQQEESIIVMQPSGPGETPIKVELARPVRPYDPYRSQPSVTEAQSIGLNTPSRTAQPHHFNVNLDSPFSDGSHIRRRHQVPVVYEDESPSRLFSTGKTKQRMPHSVPGIRVPSVDTSHKKPPFIPGGEGTPFNAYSLKQMRDRERLDEAISGSRHRGVVQQPPRIYNIHLQ